MVRSAADMRAEYVLGAESKEAPTGVQNAKRGKKGTAKEREKLAMGVMPEAKVEPVADLVVYLRLADKDNAGDVTLLHESGNIFHNDLEIVAWRKFYEMPYFFA